MRRRLGVLLGIVVLLAGLSIVSASAAWQTTGSGSGYAKAAELAVPVPTIVLESCSTGLPLVPKTATMSVAWPPASNATSYDLLWWPDSSNPIPVSPATSPATIFYDFGLLDRASVTVSAQVRVISNDWIGEYTSPQTQLLITCGLL